MKAYLLLVPFLLVARAAGQSFNVDIDPAPATFGKPANSHGGAAGQAGFWNQVTAGPSIFTRLDGTSTFSKATPSGSGFSLAEFQNPLTLADDQALMDDGLRLTGAGSSYVMQINGLQNGAYFVYSYAMAPDAPDVTLVTVAHSATGTLSCGGAWPGQHAEGVTYVRHFVNVTTFDVRITLTPQTGNGFFNGFQLVRLPENIAPFCFGSSATCPCGNGGATDAGCQNSLGTGGGKLVGSGTPLLAADTVVLAVTQLPPSATLLFFQGVSALNGLGFGDGLRCAGGGTIRLATRTALAGASSFPAGGDPALSTQGAVSSLGTRTYQVWYRNAAAFCTPQTFNLTNGVSVLWQ